MNSQRRMNYLYILAFKAHFTIYLLLVKSVACVTWEVT